MGWNVDKHTVTLYMHDIWTEARELYIHTKFSIKGTFVFFPIMSSVKFLQSL